MAIEFAFVCPLPNGIHARPASLLEEIARRFQADIRIANDRTGRRADAKSVLGIIGLDIRLNEWRHYPCHQHSILAPIGQSADWECLIIPLKVAIPC